MRRYNIILLLILCFGNITTVIRGSELEQEIDSIKKLLMITSAADKRLDLLEKISYLSMDDSTGNFWLKQLKKEAQEARQIDKEGWAIRTLARFYYNMGDVENVKLYVSQIDSLAKQTENYNDYYFDAHTFLCQLYLWDEQFEKAADAAIRLYNLAKEEKNENGIICSCETQGLINQRIGRDSVAVDFFQEGLDLLQKTGKDYRYIVQYLNNVIESELKLNRFESATGHINQLQTLITNIKNGEYGLDPSFPYDRCALLTEAFYISLYVREKNIQEAKKHIDKAVPYLDKFDDTYVHIFYMFSVASYYKLTGQYTQALNTINDVVKLDNGPEVKTLRAEILMDMGNTREAALQYKEALKQNEEINSAAFVRQLSQLHALHDMNNLELQVKELRVTELELGAKQQQLKWSLALASLLLIILILGTIIYMHTHKLKNELQKDKQALLESENALRIARDHAEESDRLKSLFLSNMSHEIRTPLNAIVGFAQILDSEMEEGDERKEYTHIIMDNSALLLNLVNDILDISRLESERYRFTFAEQNLAECCRSALTSVEHRVKPGVELRFSPEDENFMFNTDKLRLQQVIINLVGNATKFTEKGFIELAYKVDRANGFVQFTITDTGCGIPAEKQDAIFERFEKLNECVQGTGLGLSICRIIAERFNGEVLLDKKYSGGARFIFTHSLNL